MGRSSDDITLVYTSVKNAVGDERRAADLPKTALLVYGPYPKRIEPSSYLALARAQSLLEANGLTVVPGDLPNDAEQAKAWWETILFLDLATHHVGDRDRFGDKMSDRFKKIIDDGRQVTDSAYEAAVASARALRGELLKLLLPDRIIVAPAVDGVAPPFSEATGASDLQGLWSLTGVPALAVPCGDVDALPIGVQLIAHPMQEHFVRAVGRCFEGLQKGST